jgi:hypothetical protein
MINTDEARGTAVWPMSIADELADTLTPRQIEKLYEAHNLIHDMADEIELLRNSGAFLLDEKHKEATEAMLWFDRAQQWKADFSRLNGEYDVALRALRPFADCCEFIDATEDDEEWAKFRLLIKHYRAAKRAVGPE